MSYTMGSLFAGIGGFDLGFERAGFKTLWQVEIDPYCQKILAKNFPEAERFGDIKLCGIHNLKPVDVICGGFPCQDISNAGKRAGIEGERSGLWAEMHRIIRELRPRFVLVENVAALLGRGMGRVLGDLAEIGYDAEWEVISAADVGAPHLRERVWILAYTNADGCNARCEDEEGFDRPAFSSVIPFSEQRKNPSWPDTLAHSSRNRMEGERLSGERRECLADSYGSSTDVEDSEFIRCHKMVESESSGTNIQEAANSPEHTSVSGRRKWWAIEPNVGRVAHGVPARVDRLRGLGNAVVPQIPEMFAHRIREALGGTT